MDKISEIPCLILRLILADSDLTLLVCSGAAVAKPSMPEFTFKLIDSFYGILTDEEARLTAEGQG